MKPLVQAFAKCGDTSFPEAGCQGFSVLDIAYKLFRQKMMVQGDEAIAGNCILHVVAQTIIDSAKHGDMNGAGKESRWECERKFMKSYCTHWESSDDYLLTCCKCTPVGAPDPQSSNFYLGCNCQQEGADAPSGLESYSDCTSCKAAYIKRRQKLFPGCRCLEDYKKILKIQKQRGKSVCYCERAFECYYSIMNHPQRTDKRVVLEKMLKACPKASCLMSTLGQLPINMAVGGGKKELYDGVKALNSLLLGLNSANFLCTD